MASQKYRGQLTKIFYAGAYNSRPIDTGISGSSREIDVDEAGKEIDTTTRDDLLEGGTSSLATSPDRKITANGLDTFNDSRPWFAIKVGDLCCIAVYPYGTNTGYPYSYGNGVVTNRNYKSSHEGAPTWELNFKINGAWTDAVVS